MELQQEQQGKSTRSSLPTRRWLRERHAADYMGETIAGFNARVRKGYLPGPCLTDSGSKVWDRVALDRVSEQLSNIGDDDVEQAAIDAIN